MDEVLMRSAAGDGVMRDRRKTSIPIADPCGARL
jgi:hypothetical protein